MKSIVLKTAANYLLPLLLLFAVYILLRGHYRPGGGFIGGLISAIAFVLHAFAHGSANTRKLLRVSPGAFVPVGLSMTTLSAIIPMLNGDPIMTAIWLESPLPVIGTVGSALVFDIGVFTVVIGITLTILFTISENI